MNFLLSDKKICDDLLYSQYQFKKNNDIILKNQFDKSIPNTIRNVDHETALRNAQFLLDKYVCDSNLNLDEFFENCELVKECNYEKYTSNYVQDWTLIPCSTSTYKNYLIENDSKICEKSHQMFDNITKRKDITL